MSLYQTLDTPNYEQLNKEQIDFMTCFSKTLDIHAFKAIYLLIYQYYLYNEDNNNTLLPYSLIEHKQGVIITINKLPEKLQYMLYKFITVLKNNNE